MIRGIVIPQNFKGYTVTDIDFSKLKNTHFIVLEIGTPEQFGDHIYAWVAKADKAGIPCFVMQNVDLADFHADSANGGFKYLKHWIVNVKNKTLHGGFLRITNITEENGHDLPPTNVALLIEKLLNEWRTETIKYFPHDTNPQRLNRNSIMLSIDKSIVKECITPQEFVETQLAREVRLLPCDAYKTFGNILRASDLAQFDSVYSSLELIGLDGNAHSKQDALFAQSPFGHFWGHNYIQCPAISLSNGGEGIVGLIDLYMTLEQLEEWCGMKINVNTTEAPVDPDPEDPPTDNLKLAMQNSIINMATIVGDIANLLPE